MKKKFIFVNATSATVGGSLTILNQFIDNIPKDETSIYYIFVPLNYKNILQEVNNVKLVRIDAKKYFNRIKWDLYGIKKWAKKNSIYPSLIISLQNTGVRFKNVKQIVYLHQPIPYVNEVSWNLLKKDERKLWFYKNIYKYLIDFTVKNKAYVIVQTVWMKEALIKRGYYEKSIIICKPDIKNMNINNVKEEVTGCKYLFYPAANYKYKNHKIIVEAIKRIIEENNKVEDFKIIFTINKNSDIYNEILNTKIEKYFKFIGNVSYGRVLSLYKGCQAVIFPSYIETFGLPLIEASMFGKKILVSDCSYSREILNEYELSKFINYRDKDAWAKEILNSLLDYKIKPKTLKENGWNCFFYHLENILKSNFKYIYKEKS